jgi:predicted P-loop ATPase
MNQNESLSWARYYASIGLIPVAVHYITHFENVFNHELGVWTPKTFCSCGSRCAQPAKHPVVGWRMKPMDTPEQGLQTCTNTLQQNPRYGLALRTGPESGIVVIDVDMKPDKDGHSALLGALQRLGVDPNLVFSTLTQQSGGGGYHLVFRYPFNRKIPSVTNHPALGLGVDVKGEGGIFHVHPSVHKSGRQYTWSVTPAPDRILELPPELIHAIEKLSDLDPARQRLNDALEAYTPTPEDLRDFGERLKRSRKNPRTRTLGAALIDALDGKAVFLEGGAHDGYRDLAFMLTREWPLFDLETILNTLRPSLEARRLVKPDASTDEANLRDSLETALRKSKEYRDSWASKLTRTEEGGVKACSANYLIIFRNDPFFVDTLAYDSRFKTLHIRKPIEGLKPPFPRSMTSDDAAILVAIFEQRYGLVVLNPKTLLDIALAVAKETASIDPLAEWIREFEGTWDGIPRLHNFLQVIAGAPDTQWVRTVMPVWFRGFVRRVLEPGSKFDLMLILEGEQGTGKSTFFANLLPERRYFSDSLHKLAQEEGVIRALHAGPAIQEIGELASFDRSSLADLKASLSASSDYVRPLYKTSGYDAPRNFVIVGTTNDTEYLRDPTGARRFIPVQIQREFDFKTLFEIRGQLYAEALAGLAQGLPDYLTPDQFRYFHEEIADRQERDPWFYIIEDYLARHARREVTVQELLVNVLGFEANQLTRGQQMRVAHCLRMMGWKARRTLDRRFWAIEG